MTVKMLTDKRGPLQGVSVDAIIRNAYGTDARLVEDADGESAGLIQGPDGDTLDSVIEVHETDG